MAKNQKVTLTFLKSDGTETPLSFVVPGGLDGVDGLLPPVDVINPSTSVNTDQFQGYLFDATEDKTIPAAPTKTPFVVTIDGQEVAASITEYPVGDKGKYVFASGPESESPKTVGTWIVWVPIEGDSVPVVATLSQMPGALNHDTSLSGDGSQTTPLRVELNQDAGNAITLTTTGLRVEEYQLPVPDHMVDNGQMDAEDFWPHVQQVLAVRTVRAPSVQQYTTSLDGTTQNATIAYIGVDDRGTIVEVSGPYQLDPPTKVIGTYWVPADDEQPVVTISETIVAAARSLVFGDSLEGNGTADEPLGVKISAQENNALSLQADGLFAAAGGGSFVQQDMLPRVPDVTITDATDWQTVYGEFQKFVNQNGVDMVIPTKPVWWHYSNVTGGLDGGMPVADLIAIPDVLENGQPDGWWSIIRGIGANNKPWSGLQIARVVREQGTSTWFTADYAVPVSTQPGNALELISTGDGQGRAPGLFATAGGGGGLPTVPQTVMEMSSPSDFDQRINDLMNSETIPDTTQAWYLTFNYAAGGYEGHITQIPVPGEGYYVFGDGLSNDEPATRRHFAFYRQVTGAESYYTFLYDHQDTAFGEIAIAPSIEDMTLTITDV